MAQPKWIKVEGYWVTVMPKEHKVAVGIEYRKDGNPKEEILTKRWDLPPSEAFPFAERLRLDPTIRYQPDKEWIAFGLDKPGSKVD